MLADEQVPLAPPHFRERVRLEDERLRPLELDPLIGVVIRLKSGDDRFVVDLRDAGSELAGDEHHVGMEVIVEIGHQRIDGARRLRAPQIVTNRNERSITDRMRQRRRFGDKFGLGFRCQHGELRRLRPVDEAQRCAGKSCVTLREQGRRCLGQRSCGGDQIEPAVGIDVDPDGGPGSAERIIDTQLGGVIGQPPIGVDIKCRWDRPPRNRGCRRIAGAGPRRRHCRNRPMPRCAGRNSDTASPFRPRRLSAFRPVD